MSAQPQDNLVNIEVDGQAIAVPKGSMIIEAADKLGIDIPRFCYHEKLSIAANCRMCLVDVEKAPKPLPACATPVMEGMKVFTESRRAVDAQHGVMEFLLVNHPLDCPICDQGGECELQDVAMGYGRSVSRFSERKRVVKDENLGPLIATDMTRCIHCTRCVRFLEEIAGTRELGGIGRGDRTEIKTFIGRSVDSEMSANVIDLCPVGALTNKPFRFSARPWELVARPGVAMHDCVGSHLWYHTRRNQVMRAVPRDEESINEAWLSDRDRFGHLGMYAEDRLSTPMVKMGDEWQETDWDNALDVATRVIKEAIDQHSADHVGFLAAAQNTSEDFYLFQKLARGLGVSNIDHRLRELDSSDDAARALRPDLGLPIAGIEAAQTILLVASNIRHEQPILGHRVRSAWRKNNASVMAINSVDYDFRFDLSVKTITPPQHLIKSLGQVVKAAGGSLKGADDWLAGLEISDNAQAMADQLKAAGEKGWIYLGDLANSHPHASLLRGLMQSLSAATGAKLGFSVNGNSVGGWLTGVIPHRGVNGGEVTQGLSAHRQLDEYMKAYVLLNVEPEWDMGNAAQTTAAMIAADSVVALTPFASDSLRRHAKVMLPMALPQEAGGTFHNIEGRALRFESAAKMPGDARPAWKILHVLAERLGVDGLSHRGFVEVQAELDGVLAPDSKLSPSVHTHHIPTADDAMWRIGDVPMFATDAVLRRASQLQNTVHAENAMCAMNPVDVHAMGLQEGQEVRVRQGDASTKLPLQVLEQVPVGAVWVRAAVESNLSLGAAVGPLTVEGV